MPIEYLALIKKSTMVVENVIIPPIHKMDSFCPSGYLCVLTSIGNIGDNYSINGDFTPQAVINE